MKVAATHEDASWFQATARQRVDGLLDPGSFKEFLGPAKRVQSPHLSLFDLPSAFDDGVLVGRGKLEGREVLLAAQEGQFMGGTFGEVSGAKMVGLLRAARDHEHLPRVVLLLLDSGGVRLQEANAGELAVAEVMRAVVEARRAGVAVIALVGGRSGAFGGAGHHRASRQGRRERRRASLRVRRAAVAACDRAALPHVRVGSGPALAGLRRGERRGAGAGLDPARRGGSRSS